jgi:F0F1-type ATP synthase assembly protein I
MQGGDREEKNEPDDARSWAVVELALGLGIRLALPLVIGVAGGVLVDRQLGSAPLFVIAGMLAGVAASFYMLYDLASRSGR